MKFSRLSILALLMSWSSFGLISASVNDLPTREVNGHIYHYYEVAPKETVYSICHRLGITKDELVQSNPTVADGLRAGMILFFPVDGNDHASSAPTTSTPGVTMITHQVEKGQTIYGIATKYGISTQDLIDQNPIVSEGLKAGQTLHLTVPDRNVAVAVANSSAAEKAVTPPVIDEGYIVKKKETFYSIANAHGITVAQLEAANPGISVLREGQVLTIPGQQAAMTVENVVENVPADVTAPVVSAVPSIPGELSVANDTTATVSVEELATASGVTPQQTELSVAVVLPFMLNEENPAKSAQRYTEFYKGLLIAADSLRNNGQPVRISVYDTEGSTAKVNEIIANPELKTHRMIIAPDNLEQFAMLGEFGRVNNIKVLNNFIVRDETYRTNPAVMQGNIPSSLMLDKAVNAFADRMGGTTPVFLTLSDGLNDKGEFVDALKKTLDGRGIAYKTINVDGRLTQNDLKSLPAEGNYTFVPTSGRQSDVNRLLPAIIEWRDEAITPFVKVMGYPEWITFRGETLTNMHNLNTYVYSRFFDDEDAPRSKDIEQKFKRWYGAGMENAIPRQGLLGFDTGMFVFNYLKDSGARYDGVQNGFSFSVPEEASGDCNSLLYIVNYRPGGLVEKINL